jgi:hypothetical protein
MEIEPHKKFSQQSLKTGIEMGKCHRLMIEGIPLPTITVLNLAVRKIPEKKYVGLFSPRKV